MARTARRRNFRQRFGAKFFDVDIIDKFGNVTKRVGSAEERVVRRQAFTVRKIARNSMRKGTNYRSVASMPPDLQKRYEAARIRWHIRGENPKYEPRPNMMPKPGPPGSPPRYRQRGYIKKFLLAEKSPMSFKRSIRGMGFIVGPKLLPGKKTSGATTPEAHEYGGSKINKKTAGNRTRFAKYPKRPYMGPALRIAKPKFAAMWKNAVKP